MRNVYHCTQSILYNIADTASDPQDMNEGKRALLFDVDEPVELTVDEFDELWPCVSNVWVSWDRNTRANGDSWKVWICRLAKHNKSSTRKEEVPSNKRRKTLVREAGLCDTKI